MLWHSFYIKINSVKYSIKMIYLILGAIFLVSMYVQNKLKSKFAHYSKAHRPL